MFPTDLRVISWDELYYHDFEGGEDDWGFWLHPRSDKTSKIDDKFPDALDPSIELTWAVKLKKDKGEESSMWTGPFSVAAYSTLELDFYFISKKMQDDPEETDGFAIEMATSPNNWEVVEYLQPGVNLFDDEDNWVHHVFVVDVTGLNIIELRLRCQSSNKGEIHVDHTLVQATTSGGEI